MLCKIFLFYSLGKVLVCYIYVTRISIIIDTIVIVELVANSWLLCIRMMASEDIFPKEILYKSKKKIADMVKSVKENTKVDRMLKTQPEVETAEDWK